MNPTVRFALAIAAMAGGVLGLGFTERTALAQGAAKPSQAQETTIEGLTAEVTEAARKEGVLTIKVRYRNSGSAQASVDIFDYGDSSKYYVTAGTTKYLVLKDSTNAALAVNNGSHARAQIKPNGSYLFWAKYPAPPAEVKKVNYYNPHTPPFEDIPITESK